MWREPDGTETPFTQIQWWNIGFPTGEANDWDCGMFLMTGIVDRPCFLPRKPMCRFSKSHHVIFLDEKHISLKSMIDITCSCVVTYTREWTLVQINR